MNATRARRFAALCLVVASTLLAAGCDYEIPLTATATHNVDPRLLGDWVADGEDMTMKVRRLDEATYIVVCDGDLYRAIHSDVADTAFLSVQDLDSDARKYSYLAWKLSGDGSVLTLNVVNSEVVPATLRDASALQQAVKEHLRDPKLLAKDVVFRRAKA